jgi:hypothetical protein
VIVIEAVNPYVVCFVQNGGRLARDANGGPAGWTNFEIKMHKIVGGRLFYFMHTLINTFSGATSHDTTRNT